MVWWLWALTILAVLAAVIGAVLMGAASYNPDDFERRSFDRQNLMP